MQHCWALLTLPLQALAWQSDLAAMATARATLNSSVAAFVTEYRAMLYGAEVSTSGRTV
jgi:hypothetical protein